MGTERTQLPRIHGADHSRFGPDPARLAIDSTATASLSRYDQGVHSLGASAGQGLVADGAGGSLWDDVAFDLPLVSYTPVLTGSVSDPNIGLSGIIGAAYVNAGKWVHVVGGILLEGSGLSAGSGDWLITVPIPVIGPRRDVNGQAYMTTDITSPPETEWRGLEVNVLDTNFCLVYVDTEPIGQRTIFGSGSLAGAPWTLTSGDRLQFRFTYFLD